MREYADKVERDHNFWTSFECRPFLLLLLLARRVNILQGKVRALSLLSKQKVIHKGSLHNFVNLSLPLWYFTQPISADCPQSRAFSPPQCGHRLWMVPKQTGSQSTFLNQKDTQRGNCWEWTCGILCPKCKDFATIWKLRL